LLPRKVIGSINTFQSAFARFCFQLQSISSNQMMTEDQNKSTRNFCLTPAVGQRLRLSQQRWLSRNGTI
jgi:hypothetical protein